ncbi:type II toxin-antitoxin system RelE/ParE family toxin [Rhizobium skierniewicense]|uniref:type II toxin-antitoxin system RelE/ParE family toxin n=1 Tax=Rhizobium skierniewicense TaxID=984260 RepID=UPI001573EA99|nr:type II toxin-antitoxin system RelE/ParE family toxin [Rhizobium skierniewicense]
MKTRKPFWTTSAREDLFNDHIYIALENLVAADRFVFELEAKVRAFAKGGLTGVRRDELGQGLRSFTYQKRIVIFQATEEELVVLRIVHGHQDLSAIDFKQEEN